MRRSAPSTAQRRDLDDFRLVLRLQAGDEPAFDLLYTRYFKPVCGYAQMMLSDPHEAEDVAQEVLLKVFRSAPRYELRGVPFRVWIFRVARNHIRNHLAKHSRVLVEDPEAIAERVDATENSAEAIFERLADRDFMALIEPLTPDQRRVVAMRFLHGMDLGEIADMLGTSRNAVANLQYRALSTLRDILPEPSGLARDKITLAMDRQRFGLCPTTQRRLALHPS